MAPFRRTPRPEPTPLALRIRGARLHAALSQPALAAAANLTNARTVWRFEVEAREPTSSELAEIASVCAVDPGWLLTGANPPDWYDEAATAAALRATEHKTEGAAA